MPPNPHVPHPAPAPPGQSADTPGWETLELARHSAEAHATFQRLMTEAHLEYLRVIEALTNRTTDPDRHSLPRPAQARPAQDHPAQVTPVQVTPMLATPAHDRPALATLVPVTPAHDRPTQASPAQTRPTQADSAQTSPAQISPAPNSPAQEQLAQASTAQASTAQGGTAQASTAQDRPMQDRFAQASSTQDRLAQASTAQDSPTQDRLAQDRPALDRSEQAARTGNAAGGRWSSDTAGRNPHAWPFTPADRPSAAMPAEEKAAETAEEEAGQTTEETAKAGVTSGLMEQGAAEEVHQPAATGAAVTLPNAVPAQADRHGTTPEPGPGSESTECTESTQSAESTPSTQPDVGQPSAASSDQPDQHQAATTSPILPTYPSLRAGGSAALATPRTATSALDLIARVLTSTRSTPDHDTQTPPATSQTGATITIPHPAGPPQGPDPSPADPHENADRPADPIEVDVVRLTMTWAQTPLGGLAPPGLHAGPVHVVDGNSGLGTAVAAELNSRGLAAEVATHPGLGGVIFLGGLARPVSTDEAIDAQLTALWLARNGKDRGIFVTVADTLTGRSGAWLGGLVGLVGAVGRERPSASAIAIECERGDRDPAAVAVLIADELTRGAGAQRVRVAADGTRSVGRLVSAGAGEPREGGIGAESVIVASGEARGFCGAALIELARSTRCRLVLLGGAPLAAEPEHLAGAVDEVSLMRKFAAGTGGPDGLAGMRTRARAVLAAREIRATINACVAAGSETRYIHADYRDVDRLNGDLDQVRSAWGPITGLLHCAEVTVERRPGEKSAADADRSLSTHLAGLPALLAATVQDPLDTLMLFSSVAGWPGDLGQGTQALIGATLDRIAEAEQRRRPSCVVRSLAWDPADGETLPVRARAAAFVAELAVDGPAHVVLAPRSTTPDRAQPASVAIDPSTHPWLADHRPQDVAILPLAAGLGWMAAAARVREQDAVLTGVRVLRSVSTEHPQKLSVTVFGGEVWLSNDAGEPCFRSGFGAPGPDRDWRPTGDPARFPGSSVYAGRPLFHGPRLHVVRSLGEIGPDGVVGTVLGARTMGWPDDDLPVDLAALDGALQLSGVWAMDEHRPVLPMGVAECRIHRWGRLPGPALCIVADGNRDDVGTRCDAALVGPGGELWVELLGIEFVAPLSPR